MATRWEITKAVRASDLPAPARLVMLTLADVAEVGTAEIPARFTPSLTVLANETGLDRRTVQRHLLALEVAGWLVRTRPASEQQWVGERVRYQLTLPSGIEPPQVAQDRRGGGTESPGVAAQSPKGGGTEPPLYTDQSDLTDPSLPRSRAAATNSDDKRGTRIPDDFKVTPQMREWAMANVPQLAGSRETEKFVNYWRAKSGKDATKRDWVATWRNWMLNAVERYGHPNGRASPSNAPERVARDRRCTVDGHDDQPADNCRHCLVRKRARPRSP